MSHRSLTPFGHARALLRLGLPLIGSHLAQFAVVLTDTIMLGWYGVEVLAGQVLGGTMWFVLFIVSAGFGWAVVPLIAERAHMGDDVQVRRVTRMSLWLSGLAGLAAMPLFLWSPLILRGLGQVPETAGLAGAYLQLAGWSIFPALFINVIKSYLGALERTRIVFWVTVGGVAVNAAVNYVLIFGHFGFPEMGIRGAAVASLSVNAVMAVWLAAYVVRTLPEHALFVRLWRPDREAFATVFRLGWPIGLTSLAEVGLFAGASVMMGWVGTLPLAAHGIALQIASVTFLFHLGLANAATIRAGQALGRGDRAAVSMGARVAFLMSLGFAAVTVVVFLTQPRMLLGAFLDPADPAREAVLAIGIPLLAVAAIFQVFDGGQVMALGLLRGLKDTRGPMVIAAVSYWGVGMTVSYLLAFEMGFGGVGIWAGLTIGLAVAAVLLAWRFYTRGLPGVPENGSTG